MTFELLSVGTELLLGSIVNTNAQYLSRRLSELGFNVYCFPLLTKDLDDSHQRRNVLFLGLLLY